MYTLYPYESFRAFYDVMESRIVGNTLHRKSRFLGNVLHYIALDSLKIQTK